MSSKSWKKQYMRIRTAMSLVFVENEEILWLCENSSSMNNSIRDLCNYFDEFGIGYELENDIVKVFNRSELVLSITFDDSFSSIIYEDKRWEV